MTVHRQGRRQALTTLAALGAAPFLAPTAQARSGTFPNRPIRYIVPFPPGGPTDVISRPLTEALRDVIGQAVVIENVGGAAAAIGVTRIARSAPDGYTTGLGNTGSMTINPHSIPTCNKIRCATSRQYRSSLNTITYWLSRLRCRSARSMM
jgi:tripartite-type tricarboxylate transporter receptor subunit TctC